MTSELRLFAWIGVAAALLIGLQVFIHNERAAGAAQCKLEVAAATAEQERIDAANQQEAVRFARKRQAQLEVDRARAADVAGRLLQRATYRCPTPTPAASAGSAPESSPEVVPADLFRRTLRAAELLALTAGRWHSEGLACMQAVDGEP